MTPLNRILARVTIDPFSLCWIFEGGSTRWGGYGRISVEGTEVGTHRVAYESIRGRVPDGLVLDHLCRNAACANPYHVEPVAQRVNILRGTSPIARYASAVECFRGHPLTGDNLRRKRSGARGCVRCENESEARRRRDGYVTPSRLRKREAARLRGPYRAPWGERAAGATLSAAQVEEIRARIAAGETRAAVGRHFGMHPSHIGRIVSGRRWAPDQKRAGGER